MEIGRRPIRIVEQHAQNRESHIAHRNSQIHLKRSDIVFVIVFAGLFIPFFLSRRPYDFFVWFSTERAFTARLVKFAILATMGEMLGSRIRTGLFLPAGFALF